MLGRLRHPLGLEGRLESDRRKQQSDAREKRAEWGERGDGAERPQGERVRIRGSSGAS